MFDYLRLPGLGIVKAYLIGSLKEYSLSTGETSNEFLEKTGDSKNILDCQKIFQLLKDCKLNYQVVPNQGSNEVVIYLEQEEELGRVIQFKN